MPNTEETYELIEQYLAGTLAEIERAAFERRCVEEPAFAETMAFYLQSRKASEIAADEQKKATFRQQYLDWSERQKKSRAISILSYSGIAATILLLVAVYVLWPANVMQPEQIFMQYFEGELAPETMGVQTDSLLSIAHLRHNQQYYTEARSIYEQLLVDSSFQRRTETHFYLGLTYMRLEDPQKALQNFNEIGPEMLMFESAQWYSAFANLQSGNIAESKSLFDSFAKGESIYRNTAVRILKEFDRLE